MIDKAVEPQEIKKPRAPYAAPALVLLDVESATEALAGSGADGGSPGFFHAAS